MKHLLLSTIICLLFSFKGNSTHIIGSTLEYEHIGNDDYIVKVTLRRDGSPVNALFPTIVELDVYTSYGAQNLNAFTLPRDTIIDILTADTNYTCNYSFQYNIQVATYIDTITITNNPGMYLAYQVCCRSFSINNILNPGDKKSTVYSFIPPVSNTVNSSAHWDSVVPPYYKIGTNLSVDFSASDADGDSLVYNLYTPFDYFSGFDPQQSNPDKLLFNPVTWENGYSQNQPLHLNPLSNGGVTLDPNTGIMTGTLQDMGVYVIGIKCDEYRNGTKINSIYRDLTLFSVDFFSTAFETNQTCSNEIEFINNSVVADDSCIWNFGDGSPDFATINSDTVYHQFPGTNSSYNVLLITSPNTSCADTIFHTVILDSFSIDIVLPDTIYVTDSLQLSITHQLDSTFEFIDWEINQSLSFTTLSDTTLTLNTGYNYITAEMSNNAGCTISSNDSILVLNTPLLNINFNLDNSTLMDTLYLTSNTSNLSSIQWSSNGDGIFLPDNTSTNVKYALGTADKLDSSVVIFLNGNIYARSSLIDSISFDFHASNFSTSNNLTVNETVSFYEQVQNNIPITSWKWKFGNGDISTISNPTYVYSASNTYLVTLEANNENEYFITSKNIFIGESDVSLPEEFGSTSITFINTPVHFAAVKESDDHLEIQVINSIGQVIKKDIFITDFKINKEYLSTGLFIVVIKDQKGEFITRSFVVN